MQIDRETIIKLARESGLIYWHPKPSSVIQKQAAGVWWIDAGEPGDELEYFARLVAEHVIKDAPDYKMGYADGVAVEREACAKVADSAADSIGPIEFDVGASIAAAIRARGNT